MAYKRTTVSTAVTHTIKTKRGNNQSDKASLFKP